MTRHGIESDELMETWRNRVTDAIGGAEGLRDYLNQFIREANQILHNWGVPFPLGMEMAHLSDYRATVNEVIGHLEDSMKVYHEYRELFGDTNFIRCDGCQQFKSDCQDYPDKNGNDTMFLCLDCALGLTDRLPVAGGAR